MIRTGGSRLAFSPRVARDLRPGLRHRGVRRRTAGLRRPSRPALSSLARDRARPGAVGVESGLVGGISGTAVLSAGLRLPGRGPAACLRQLAFGRDRVSGDRLDRVPGAGADDLPGARARARERLARAAGSVRGSHALGRRQQRRRGRRTRRDARGAARVGARPAAGPDREHPRARLGRGARDRRLRRGAGVAGPARPRASPRRGGDGARRRALSVGDGARRRRRPVRARAARHALAPGQPRRRRRLDRVHPRGGPRLVRSARGLSGTSHRFPPPRARDGTRGRAAGRGRLLAEPADAHALAPRGRLAFARVDRARSETPRPLGRAARSAGGPCPVREVGGAPRLRSGAPGVVSTSHARHGPDPAVREPGDRQRHVHPSLADRGADLPRRRGAGSDHPPGRAARRRLAVWPPAGRARPRDLPALRGEARHQRRGGDRRGRAASERPRRERRLRQTRLTGAVPDLRAARSGGAAACRRSGPLDAHPGGRSRRLDVGADRLLSALASARRRRADRDATGTRRRPRGEAGPRRWRSDDRARLSPGRSRDLWDRGDRGRRDRARRFTPTREGRVRAERVDGQSGLLLFAAGLAGGIVTAMVGGASLITFPALLAAGLPAIVANASSTVALTPGNLVAGFADLERRPRWDRSFVSLALISVVGSVAGAALLLATPEKAFTAVVPLLIGFATILFALSGRIRRWIVSRTADGGHPTGWGNLLFAPVAIYGGYFGAGMSVMILAIMSVTRTDDFRAANVIKNLLSGLTSFVAVVVFVFQGMVAWPPTLAVMAGAVIGGFLGGRLARVLPPDVMRWTVITVGSVLTPVYAYRYWLR